jgi:hypothetical protein
VAKYKEGIFLLYPEGERKGAEHEAEKACVEVGQFSSHCGESQTLHCLPSSREKLISNLQACPGSGRGW